MPPFTTLQWLLSQCPLTKSQVFLYSPGTLRGFESLPYTRPSPPLRYFFTSMSMSSLLLFPLPLGFLANSYFLRFQQHRLLQEATPAAPRLGQDPCWGCQGSLAAPATCTQNNS